MSNLRAAAVLGVLLTGAAAFDEGRAMSRKPEEMPRRPAPAIDGERPAETQIADFALG